MIEPAVDEHEGQRLAALDALGLLYTPSEERFDRITRMASRLFGTPMAMITFVADRCQWFKSAQGLEETETAREVSFCAHAILQDETFVVPNATADERFFDNPLVTGGLGIRFYAGHPVYAEDGSPIGTVCVIDRQPREFSQSDRDSLRDLAALVETELHREQLSETQRELIAERDVLERKASIDGLTRLWNRDTILRLLQMEVSRAARGKPLTVAILDVDNFKTVNDTHGHAAGDRVLAHVAERIRGGVRDFDAVGRYGGDEFLAVLGDCRLETAAAVCERVRAAVEGAAIETGAAPLKTSVTIGLASYATTYRTVEEFVAAADEALYRAKKGGRNRIAAAGVDGPLQPPGMTSWRHRKRF